jgi:cell division protein FtsL
MSSTSRSAVRLTDQITKVIIAADPRASINDLCKLCVDSGLPVSKSLVAAVRRQIHEAVRGHPAAMNPPGSLTEQDTSEMMQTLLSAPIPAAALLVTATHQNPEEMREQAEEKARKQAEREAKWAARQAEREAEWAAERAEVDRLAQEAIDATPEPDSDAMNPAPAAPEPIPLTESVPRVQLQVTANPDARKRNMLDADLAWLARQANDIMRAHGLTELSLVVEGGRAKWKYQVVKRAEGEISL